MFDDLKQADAPTTAQTEDIFSDMADQTIQSQSPITPAVPEMSSGTFSPQTWWRGWMTVVVIVVILLVVLLGAYWWWQSGTSKSSPVNVVSPQPIEQPQSTPLPPPTNTNTTPPVDSDGDGLSDTEEQSLGTDPQKADTDSDGLFDREEVKVYKTDPLKADTDNDGFTDGVEVQSGYNPNGTGKLLQLP